MESQSVWTCSPAIIPSSSRCSEARLLAGGHDDHAARTSCSEPGTSTATAAAVDAGLAELCLVRSAARSWPPTLIDADRLGVVDELDPLLDRAVQLVLARRDLVGAAAVHDLHVLAAGQALGDAAGIHGDVAAADDEHGRRQGGPLAAVHPAQELDAVDDLRIDRRWRCRRPFAHHAPIVSRTASWRVLELVQGDARPSAQVEVDVDTRAAPKDPVDVLVEDPRRATEGRDAPGHIAAEQVRELVDVHLEAGFGEVLRRGQARRARCRRWRPSPSASPATGGR